MKNQTSVSTNSTLTSESNALKVQSSTNAQETKLYLAYGSNLNISQMAHRCPTARIVGSDILKDYRLLFRGQNGSAVATVEAHEDGRVPVLVWEIKPKDEAALDIYEGFPGFYRKETWQVQHSGESCEAMIYIMNITDAYRNVRHLGSPSRYYYNIIREGYRRITSGLKLKGFDTAILEEAERVSVRPECEVLELVKEQILAIRNTGAANMFDIARIKELAKEMGFTELEQYLSRRKHGMAYSRFILSGNIEDLSVTVNNL